MKTKLRALFQRFLNYIKRNPKKSALVFILLVVYYFSLPRTLFEEPYSTVIESSDGELLAAKIARDGQWRFPAKDSIPDKFKKCIVYYEDEHFYQHFGFNPVAMVKAIQQNRSAGRVVRGGSTLTQQVIRLSRKNKKLTTKVSKEAQRSQSKRHCVLSAFLVFLVVKIIINENKT